MEKWYCSDCNIPIVWKANTPPDWFPLPKGWKVDRVSFVFTIVYAYRENGSEEIHWDT